MPTISANIKYVTNIEDLRRELKSGTDQLVVLEKAAERTTRNLGGEGLIRAAHNAAAAIENLGGVTKLTASEQEKIHSLLGRAIDKYNALGQAAPAALKQIYDATVKVEPPTSRLAGFMNDLGKQIATTAAGFISAQAVIGGVRAAIHGLTEFIDSSIEAYSQQETAIKRMTTALQSQGSATPQVIKSYQDLASEFQNTTVFSDELINEMQALLVEVGNVMPSQMKGALKAATDLASGLGIDLRTATLLVGKAFEGETGTLKRYGIVIDETKLKTEGVTAVLDAIQTKFGGQAQAEIETYAGKVKQLSNQWGELKEAIGKNIVDNPLLVAAMRLATEEAKRQKEETAAASDELSRRLQPFGLLGKAYLYIAEQAKAANTETANFARALANAPNINNIFGGNQRPAQFGTNLIDAKQLVNDWAEAQRKAAEAVKRHAETVQQLADKYSGAALARHVRDLSEAMQQLKPGDNFKLLAEDIGKLFDQGAKLTPQMIQLGIAFNTLLPNVTEGSEAFMKLGTAFSTGGLMPARELGDLLPKVEVGIGNLVNILPKLDLKYQFTLAKPPADDLIKVLGEMTQSLSQLAQISDGVFSDIARGLSTLVAAADTAAKSLKSIHQGQEDWKNGSTFAGILGMTSGVLGLVTAAISAGKALATLFDRNKGRDVVVDFAQGFGGFDALHAKLLELGDEGEAFWIKLTQGVGRNNPAQARAVIEEINAALRKHEQTLTETGKAAQIMGEQESEAIQQARQAVADLDSKIASLNQSIANEAPEEEMGIIERNTRAQIASLEAQREEAAKTLEDLTRDMTTSMEDVAKAIDALPDNIALSIKVALQTELPEGSAAPVSTGGYVGIGKVLTAAFGGVVPQYLGAGGIGRLVRFKPRGTDTVPAMLTPGEGVLNTRAMRYLGQTNLHALNSGINPWAAQLLATGTDGGRSVQTAVVLQVDKRELARAIVDVYPGETRRLGIPVRSS